MSSSSVAPANPKAETLGVSLPVAEAQAIRDLASAEGRPISTVIRRGLLAAGYIRADAEVAS